MCSTAVRNCCTLHSNSRNDNVNIHHTLVSKVTPTHDPFESYSTAPELGNMLCDIKLVANSTKIQPDVQKGVDRDSECSCAIYTCYIKCLQHCSTTAYSAPKLSVV